MRWTIRHQSFIDRVAEQLPISRVKLGSSFTRAHRCERAVRFDRPRNDKAGSELGLQVTAEGVERLEQFAALSDCRGMTLQGLLMSKPVSREKLMP